VLEPWPQLGRHSLAKLDAQLPFGQLAPVERLADACRSKLDQLGDGKDST
jgi:hypothetical protein